MHTRAHTYGLSTILEKRRPSKNELLISAFWRAARFASFVRFDSAVTPCAHLI